MANNNNVPSPVLSLPPLEYDVQYFNNLVRLLNYFIEQQDNAGRIRGTSLTIAQPTPSPEISVSAPAIKARQGYVITGVGTTNFTSFGASSNTVGIHFISSKDGSAGSGTGSVQTVQYIEGLIAPVSASMIQAGESYTITSVGTTNYTAIGASSNTVGIRFKATGSASGTGTVIETTVPGVVWCDTFAGNTLKIIP